MLIPRKIRRLPVLCFQGMIPRINKIRLSRSWGAAFQSPEFMAGLQTAVSQALRQSTSNEDRAATLEAIGNPSQVGADSQVGESARQTGTWVAPQQQFISYSSNLTESRALPVVNNVMLSNELGTQSNSIAALNVSAESAFILGPGRAPVPAKLVRKILSHEYVDMSELTPENLEAPQLEMPVLAWEGTMVVTKTSVPKRNTVYRHFNLGRMLYQLHRSSFDFFPYKVTRSRCLHGADYTHG